MKQNELLVVALGGNAIKQAHERGTTEEQFQNIDATARQLARLVRLGYGLAVTHGNGPQAGALLIQQEESGSLVPAQSLAVCGAMTQGQIGWMLQNRIRFHLGSAGIERPCASLVTQVVVDENDPDFADPSKPVGPFYTREEAAGLAETKGYTVREVKPGDEKGWRRVVPSPSPKEIVEADLIRSLVSSGVILIASGGGGVPVRRIGNGDLRGVDAVIDKDRAGFLLARTIDADRFIILTDVETVYLNIDTPERTPVHALTVDQAAGYMTEGHFLEGSMGPKVESCLDFTRVCGRESIITSLHTLEEALEGRTGTRFLP
ncbi:MAG: carbamate kinase [Spirochaetia bacterium]